MKASPEAAVLWIQTERSVFRLFYSIQLALKSKKEDVKPYNVMGPALLFKFVNDVLSIQVPVICSSAFILSVLFNVSFL